jgi:hypothetical protein
VRLAILLLCAAAAFAQRLTIPLDGTWQIEDSLGATDIPEQWRHTVPVPGLANLAQPAFPNVDEFDSREVINNRIRKKVLPPEALPKTAGTPKQNRTYFWYRRTFAAPAAKQVAILKIAKAQFGTAVWVNGKSVGEHAGCFTAGYFDVTPAIRWNTENEVIVRIGAHPAALPASIPTGTDFEKLKWTPGIYDKVALYVSNNPVIETIQVAPRINPPAITVQTVLRNYGKSAANAQIAHSVTEWRGGKAVTRGTPRKVMLSPGGAETVTEEIALPGARLWSPEDPFLYVLKTTTGGDSAETRFGVREFRFDTPTRRAWLNGKPYFLRGSNITLHRFFEDPKCGRLPWDETWVRKLLAEIPKKQMHWNSFRFCIGPAPEFWFDVADEAGLLIQNEYFIWTGKESWAGRAERWNEWSVPQLFTEYREFMRDHWNHPSMALWDASNETDAAVLAEKIIPEVRKLDLSNRSWENGYNLPSGPDDPVEDHPYLFQRIQSGGKFSMTELENMTGAKSTNSPHPTGHAAFINEYGWLWLNRDGTPTELTDKVYEHLVGVNATPEQRFKKNAYLLAGLTEFWRAHRNFAGVLHFVYLMSSYPGVYTSDHFRDVEKLELEPNFAEWVGEAFKPLGVYVNFWHETLKSSARRQYAVMLVNDYQQELTGKLTLAWLSETGEEAARAEREFRLAPNGQMSYDIPLATPPKPGRYTLRATAASPQVRDTRPTISRREVRVE